MTIQISYMFLVGVLRENTFSNCNCFTCRRNFIFVCAFIKFKNISMYYIPYIGFWTSPDLNFHNIMIIHIISISAISLPSLPNWIKVVIQPLLGACCFRYQCFL